VSAATAPTTEATTAAATAVFIGQASFFSSLFRFVFKSFKKPLRWPQAEISPLAYGLLLLPPPISSGVLF
jgi:hypothetical protein